MARYSNKPIKIGGKKLHELSLQEIVGHALRRDHQRFDLGPDQDYWRNRELLTAFGDSDFEPLTVLLDRYHNASRDDYSAHFNALRLGEVLLFALEYGLVKYELGGWKLLQPEQQFELVGPAAKPRAIRVRGLAGPEAVIAAKLWTRELKRRERARLKRLGQYKSSIGGWLDKIVARCPQCPLEGPLEPFGFGDFQTIGAVYQTIYDAVDGMTLEEAYALDKLLRNIAVNSKVPPRPPRVSAADDAILSNLEI